MKAHRQIALSVCFALFIALFVVGCEEDPLSIGDDPGMSAKVDGTAWAAGNNVDGTVFSSLKTITGTQGDGSSITLNLTNIFDLGTYDVEDGKFSGLYAESNNVDKIYAAKSGTVEITELSGNDISGTFSFVGENEGGSTMEITEGTFNVTLR